MTEDKERRARYENALGIAKEHGNRMFEAAILKEIRLMDQESTGKTITPDPAELEAVDEVASTLKQFNIELPTRDELYDV